MQFDSECIYSGYLVFSEARSQGNVNRYSFKGRGFYNKAVGLFHSLNNYVHSVRIFLRDRLQNQPKLTGPGSLKQTKHHAFPSEESPTEFDEVHSPL